MLKIFSLPFLNLHTPNCNNIVIEKMKKKGKNYIGINYIRIAYVATLTIGFIHNHKNYNFLDCGWFKKLLFSTNSLAKLLSDSLLLDSL